MATLHLAESPLVVRNAVPFIIVEDGALDGFFGEHGAVHLVRGQAVQSFGYRFVAALLPNQKEQPLQSQPPFLLL